MTTESLKNKTCTGVTLQSFKNCMGDKIINKQKSQVITILAYFYVPIK
jgi:hypothetical protein